MARAQEKAAELNERIRQQAPQFIPVPTANGYYTTYSSLPPSLSPPPPSFYAGISYPSPTSSPSPPPPPSSFYTASGRTSPPPPPPSFYQPHPSPQSPRQSQSPTQLPMQQPLSSYVPHRFERASRQERKLAVQSPRSPSSRTTAKPIRSPRSLLNSSVNAYLLANYGLSLKILQDRVNACKIGRPTDRQTNQSDRTDRSCAQIDADEKIPSIVKLGEMRQRQAEYLECASSRDLVTSAFAAVGNLDDRQQLRAYENHRFAEKVLRDEAKSCNDLASRIVTETILRDRSLRDLHRRADALTAISNQDEFETYPIDVARTVRAVEDREQKRLLSSLSSLYNGSGSVEDVTVYPSPPTSTSSSLSTAPFTQFQVQLPNNPLGFENSVPFQWIPSQRSSRSALNRQ